MLNYDGLWESRKCSNEIRRFSCIKLIDWYRLVNIDWLADIDWLDDLTCSSYSVRGKAPRKDPVGKGSNFADFVRFCPHSYARIQQYMLPLMVGNDSCHPSHVIWSTPERRFIKIQQISSEKNDYVYHSNEIVTNFVGRVYDEKRLLNSMIDMLSTKGAEYLNKKFNGPQDPNSIFVCTWYPSPKHLRKILKDHFPLLESNTQTA